MDLFSGQTTIKRLPERKGAYTYIELSKELVSTFPQQRKTRLICTLEGKVSYSCGLNHLGDGNFFIILSTKNLKEVGKYEGDDLAFTLKLDPNPLGVEIPEVLQVYLDQDNEIKSAFEMLTDGKKRNLIFRIVAIKNLDKQIEMIQSNLKQKNR